MGISQYFAVFQSLFYDFLIYLSKFCYDVIIVIIIEIYRHYLESTVRCRLSIFRKSFIITPEEAPSVTGAGVALSREESSSRNS